MSAPAAKPAKAGAQRSTKNASKLKLLPADSLADVRATESGRDVYSQLDQIEGTTARRDAERLGKAHRKRLPRVTAFCTAGSYKMDSLFKFFQARRTSHHSVPKRVDECIYSPYSYTGGPPAEADLLGLEDLLSDSDRPAHVMSEIFAFEYGCVVLWGFTEELEKRFLRELARFEVEKLLDDDVEVEEFNYYTTTQYTSRIYNDFITLRDGRNYMIKLAISHAIAQSVKISLFEELVDATIEDTKDIPQSVAETGKVSMSRKQIMRNVGELFILRININLSGSVLDSPELCWSEPNLEPVYKAARSYLEISQRVSLLNQRVQVISDLLSMLKEQMTHSQGEYLEWIVIILIALEIAIAVLNVIVDVSGE
ncbi:sporulation protein rmd1 [Savitreella phatthalungensis]